jgi:hypothetical protein
MLSRRVFLKKLSLLLVSVALAACKRREPTATPTPTSTPTPTNTPTATPFPMPTCYPPWTPVPTQPPSSEDLRVQAQLLTEMGEQGELQSDTLARARGSVERDLALLARSDDGK